MWKFTYLFDESAFANRHYKLISYSVLSVWLLLVFFLAMHHEVWRDEMRAYVIADNANNFFEIPALLINDGHPPLWHFLLFFVNIFISSPLSLQITAIPISFISIFLFFRFSPFNNFFKILFIFGIIPLYEYTVFSRNYGISMLFMILATMIITRRKIHPIFFYLVVSLLALTNIHSLVLCVFLLFLYSVFNKINEIANNWITHAIGLVLVIVSIVFSLSVSLPDENSIYSSTLPGFIDIVGVALMQLIVLGEGFGSIFFGYHPILKTIMFWIVALGLIRKPILFIVYILTAIGFGVFFNIGYPPSLRHEGLFFIFTIMLYWISFSDRIHDQYFFRSNVNPYIIASSKVFLIVLLLLQFKYGAEASLRSVDSAVSSSKQFAKFIKANDEFHNAVIIGDIDVVLESIPYYLDNRIYLSREKRFGRRVNLTIDRQQVISFQELIDDAFYLLSRNDTETILILLSHDLSEIPFLNNAEYLNDDFKLKGYASFVEHTRFLESFKGSLKGEDYDVYQFVPAK